MLLVRRLRWPSLLLVLGPDEASQDTGDQLVQLADEDPDVCVQRRVLSLSEDSRGDSDVAWAVSKDTSGGVVVIADSTDRVASVLSRLSTMSPSGPGGVLHVLVSVREASASARQLATLHGVVISLLHEVSPASLVPGMQRALLAESSLWSSINAHPSEQDIMTATALQPDSQDASVGAMVIAVQLVASALRAAHRIKCPAALAAPVAPPPSGETAPPAIFCPALRVMAPDEWRSILERVTAFAEPTSPPGLAGQGAGSLPAKLRFGMELRTATRVLVKRSDSDEFEKVGLLIGGKDLQMDSPRYSFPAPRPGADDDCGGGTGGRTATGGTSSRGSSPTATTATPQRPATKTKYNRALDRYPRSTPEPRGASGGGGSGDVDWSWIIGGSSNGVWNSRDFDGYQMLYMLCGAGAVMLLIFLLCFYIVYKSFRVKPGNRRDSDSDSSRKSRASSKS